MKLLGTILLLTVLGASAARAQPADAPCANGAVPTERDLGLAKVVGAGRLNFLNEGPGCPSEAATGRQRAYVVSGDLLLPGRSAGAYVCVFYPNTGGGSAGSTSARNAMHRSISSRTGITGLRLPLVA